MLISSTKNRNKNFKQNKNFSFIALDKWVLELVSRLSDQFHFSPKISLLFISSDKQLHKPERYPSKALLKKDWHFQQCSLFSSTRICPRGLLVFLKSIITEIFSTIFQVKCKTSVIYKKKKVTLWNSDQYKINIAGTMKHWSEFIIKNFNTTYKCCQNKQKVTFRLSSQIFLLSANRSKFRAFHY